MRLKKRLDRRDRTWRKCQRRARVQRGLGFTWTGSAAETHRNHKRGVEAHRCRKRKHGQPKRGQGLCYAQGHEIRPAVEERKKGRRICREWDED